MKRALPFLPFGTLVAASLAAHWIDGGKVLGDIWAAAFVSCLLFVPVLSRKALWLGYLGLLFPFAVLTAFVVFDWGPLSVGF